MYEAVGVRLRLQWNQDSTYRRSVKYLLRKATGRKQRQDGVTNVKGYELTYKYITAGI